MWRPNSWARRVLGEKVPCRYCYKWGHWVANCPLYKAKKPLVGDPRLANPNFKIHKSSLCHPGLLRQGNRQAAPQSQAGRSQANIASIQQGVDEQDLALLDSGATDSVSNGVSLFTCMRPTCMNLIVASTDWLPVRSVGDVEIPTPEGALQISNVLYCPNIKGTIISIGQFKVADGEVKWDGD